MRQSSIATNWTDGISQKTTDTTKAIEIKAGFRKTAATIRVGRVCCQRRSAQRQAGTQRAARIGGHQDQWRKVVQHQMLEPMDEELVLGVVIEPGVERDIE
jgi:hypothetical protein